jgi:hypothetical protein
MTIPGPSTLIAGDMQAGYFGTVSANDFITGNALCSAIGLSAGISQFSNTDWLKFAYKGKIQFVAMKPIRYNLSWDRINSAGAIYGKNITIDGLTYKVRSFRGAEHDPTNSYADTDKDAIGSEWNDLMLPIHAEATTGSWTHPQYVGTVPNWGIGFTDADLLTHRNYGNGSYTWCQEVQDTYTIERVVRGYNGVAYLYSVTASGFSSYTGFRPVLELESIPGTDFLESILDSFRHSENCLYPRSKYRPIVLFTNVNTTIKSGRVRLVVLRAVSHCMEHFYRTCNKLRSANYIASVKSLSDSFSGRIRISREVLGIKLSKLRIKGYVTLVKDRISLSVLAVHTRGKAVAVKIIIKVNEIATKYRQITQKVKTATHNLTNFYQNRRLTRALMFPQETKHRDEQLIVLYKLLLSSLHTVTSSGHALGMIKNLKASLQIVTVSYSRIRNWTMRLFGKVKSGSLLGKIKSGSLLGKIKSGSLRGKVRD